MDYTIIFLTGVIEIIIQTGLHATVEGTTVVANINENVTLPCELNCTYPTWSGPLTNAYTYGGQIHPDVRDHVKWANNYRDLIVLNVTQGDEGRYTCNCTYGTTLLTVVLQVKAWPQLHEISNREIVGSRYVVRGTEDQSMTLTCISRDAYPEPHVKWTNGSTFLPVTFSSSYTNPFGYFTVTVEYTFTALRDYDRDKYSCQSSFNASDEPLVSSVLLYLDLKPSYPLIYSNDTHTEGQSSTFQCTSSGCRPQGGITWKYDGNAISRPVSFSFDSVAETYTMTSTYTTGELSRTDNGKRVECIVTHKTLTDLSNRTQSRDVNIKFSPLSLHLSGNHQIVANGVNILQLTCISGSANPAANITWRNGLLPITSGIVRSASSGDYDGIVVTETLTLKPTRFMDGDVISCTTSNPVSHPAVIRNETTLDLFYHPVTHVPAEVNATEDEPNVTLRCYANSKPPSSFKWFRSGSEVLILQGSGTTNENYLDYRISLVSRDDAGQYRCEAENTIGTPDNSNSLLTLNVFYAPDVFVNTTNGTVNDPQRSLICAASGFPSIYTYSEWTQTWPGSGSILRAQPGTREWILNPLTYEDTGIYQCGASNHVARWNTLETVMKGTVFLLIKSLPVVTKPILQSKDNVHKIPGILGKTFTVILEIYSNFDDDVVISLQDNNTRSIGNSFIQKKVGDVELPVHGQTVPTSGIHINVTHTLASEDDFGEFHIKIQNPIGITDYRFEVVAEGPPCSPIDPSVEKSQQKNVVVSWIRCFHGGFSQTFVVQYSTDQTLWINATTVDGGLSTSKERLNATLTNLQADTAYLIRIFSYNVYGSSDYSAYLNVTTKSEAFAQPQPETVSGALAAGWAVAGVLALALIVSLFLSYRNGRLPGCRKSNVKKETTFSSNASENNRSTPGNRGNHGDYDNLRRGSSSYENAAHQPIAPGTDEQTSASVYDDLRPEKKAEHLYSTMQGVSSRAKAPPVIYSDLKMSAPE